VTVKKPENVIFHCSASMFGDAATIRRWHLARGWRDIGYHFVVLNGCREGAKYREEDDGLIEAGRPLNRDGVLEPWEFGAHALGYNDKSIGVCFVGERFFTNVQVIKGTALLAALVDHFGIATENILGHRETGANKECPTMHEDYIRALVNVFRGWTEIKTLIPWSTEVPS
jgi:N-acetylmuramoyl-L-alanine amidase